MPLTQTVPSVGNATKADEAIAFRDNDRICGAGVVAGHPLLIGGSHDDFEYGTTYARLPDCPAFEIDGALAQYVTVYLEAEAIREPSASGTVSCVVDLYNLTDAAQVSGSELTISVDVANPSTKHGKTSSFTLNSGVKRYHFRIKTGTSLVGVAAWVKLVGKSS
jgi:hypothetical protein